jgi:hypothetical protein
MLPTVRKEIGDAIMLRVKDIDLSPIEVMLRDMKLQYVETRRLLERVEEMPETTVAEQVMKDEAMRVVRASSSQAAESAMRVAPYIHAKLQSVTVKGDKENPLEIALGLSDASRLKALVRGTEVEGEVLSSVLGAQEGMSSAPGEVPPRVQVERDIEDAAL